MCRTWTSGLSTCLQWTMSLQTATPSSTSATRSFRSTTSSTNSEFVSFPRIYDSVRVDVGSRGWALRATFDTPCSAYVISGPLRGLAWTPLLADWGTSAAVYRPLAWQNKTPGDLKIKENVERSGLGHEPRWRSLQRSPRPHCWWGRASCPLPRTPSPL